IPIAIVVEEETELVEELMEKIQQTPNLHVQILSSRTAFYKLEKYELDSVFVIRKGYEETLKSNDRNQVMKAYSTDRSIAYFATVETVSSYVQDQASRYKAVANVQDVFQQYNIDETVDEANVIAKTKEHLETGDLIASSFRYMSDVDEEESESLTLVNVWGMWALFSMLATFFLFDWVMKENPRSISVRWLFTNVTFERYSSWNLGFYTVLIGIVDVLTMMVFYTVLDVAISWDIVYVVLIFRVTINIVCFLVAQQFTKPFFYYVAGILSSLLLTVLGGALVPIDGLAQRWSGVQSLSPVHALLIEEPNWIWLTGSIILLGAWLWRRRRLHASS
ncbi:MAG: ABC transporter permease, partial [Lysinibacillus sp.]